jgi:hypothetical protein
MEILIYKNGEQHGPMNEVAVKEAVARGEFCGEDMGWREGCESWVPLKTIVALPPVMPASVRVPVRVPVAAKVAATRGPAAAGGAPRSGAGGSLASLGWVLAGVRRRTAYRGARTMVSAPFNIIGGLLLVLGIAMVVMTVTGLGETVMLGPGLLMASGMIIAGLFHLGLAALASAVFDIADAALARRADGEARG